MAFILAPRTELRILSQLPRLQQTFRPGNSRASCSWTRIGAANQYRLRSRAQDTLRYHLHRDQCLSTSAARKADPRDTNKHAGGAPVHNEKPEVSFKFSQKQILNRTSKPSKIRSLSTLLYTCHVSIQFLFKSFKLRPISAIRRHWRIMNCGQWSSSFLLCIQFYL